MVHTVSAVRPAQSALTLRPTYGDGGNITGRVLVAGVLGEVRAFGKIEQLIIALFRDAGVHFWTVFAWPAI